ncbi:hypothetical protein [Bradyrhizobium sp. STM 3809]|uniref:hypothetical protein n=1 Tax=Bradyrhizobium sp. STM 3809 TaxID=551936 RepID=UPI0003185CFD|nr:hypothetical protein [Bradyrhizobium sp. STM 3809]
MRYVSWFRGWLGHLLPQQPHEAGGIRRDLVVRRRGPELSSEDLFYIAMLGPHV